MDKFEKLIEELNELSNKERDERIEIIGKDCVCSTCPSYNQCAKDNNEFLFCVRGKSDSCITEKKGCMCPTCPIAAKYEIGVLRNFYCVNGSELDQRKSII